jgi:serine/threonine protein phosphatase PrpC
MHEDARQGYTSTKPSIYFGGQSHPYTEDTGTTFVIDYPTARTDDDAPVRALIVSSVCDGHAGYTTSYTVTKRIPELFPTCLDDARGDIPDALTRLFAALALETSQMSSGTTCNVTVFDPASEKVHVASLGDSPTLRYRKGPRGLFRLVWQSVDQDCADQAEIDRMVDVHRRNGDLTADASSVVYQVMTGGQPTGVWRNRHTQCMMHSSFGDVHNNYYPGMVNTVPRIYTHDWSPTQRSDVWVQCTDGLLEWLNHSKVGIQPCCEFRVAEIARHLDVCHRHANVAKSLNDMQIESMFRARIKAHPELTTSTRQWVETSFDNHLSKVFTWEE